MIPPGVARTGPLDSRWMTRWSGVGSGAGAGSSRKDGDEALDGFASQAYAVHGHGGQRGHHVLTKLVVVPPEDARGLGHVANEVDAKLVAPSPAAPAKVSSFNADFTLVGTDVLFARITEDEGARRVVALIKGYGA